MICVVLGCFSLLPSFVGDKEESKKLAYGYISPAACSQGCHNFVAGAMIGGF